MLVIEVDNIVCNGRFDIICKVGVMREDNSYSDLRIIWWCIGYSISIVSFLIIFNIIFGSICFFINGYCCVIWKGMIGC